MGYKKGEASKIPICQSLQEALNQQGLGMGPKAQHFPTPKTDQPAYQKMEIKWALSPNP